MASISAGTGVSGCPSSDSGMEQLATTGRMYVGGRPCGRVNRWWQAKEMAAVVSAMCGSPSQCNG